MWVAVVVLVNCITFLPMTEKEILTDKYSMFGSYLRITS